MVIVGYTYAGMADGNKCYCGNSGYDQFGISTDCTIPCIGDFNHMCGGDDSLSVYNIGTYVLDHTNAFRVITLPPAVINLGFIQDVVVNVLSILSKLLKNGI